MGFKDFLNVYEFESKLLGSGQVVKYKPITTTELKKLLVYENETNPINIEKAFDELITSCVISEGFNVNDLLLQDRHFLIIELRKASKGDIYEFTFKCPKCKSDNMTGINFNDFKVVKKLENIDNKIEINKDTALYLDHATRGNQIEAYDKIDTKQGMTQIKTDMALHSIATYITGIETPDGIEKDLTLDDKLFIVSKLSFKTFDKIKK